MRLSTILVKVDSYYLIHTAASARWWSFALGYSNRFNGLEWT